MRLSTAALVLAAVTLGGQFVLANIGFEDTGLDARELDDFEEFDARAPETIANFDLDARFADFEGDSLDARSVDFDDEGLEARGGVPPGIIDALKRHGKGIGRRILRSPFRRDVQGISDLEVREAVDEAVGIAKATKREHRRVAGKLRKAAAQRRFKGSLLRKAGLKKSGAQQRRIAVGHEDKAAEHEEIARELGEDIEIAERYFDELSGDIEARDFEDYEDIDAKEYGEPEDFEAREFGDLDDVYGREYEELEDVFGREFEELEDLVERASTSPSVAATTASASVSATSTGTAATASPSAIGKAKLKHHEKPKPHHRNHKNLKKYGKAKLTLKRKPHHRRPHYRPKPGHLRAKPHRKPHHKHKKGKKQGAKATPTPALSASITASVSSTSKVVSSTSASSASTPTSTSSSTSATASATASAKTKA